MHIKYNICKPQEMKHKYCLEPLKVSINIMKLSMLLFIIKTYYF